MFEKNILTFNPGEIQKQLKAKGMKMLTEADEAKEGPAHFVIEDPDGNQILVDQHR